MSLRKLPLFIFALSVAGIANAGELVGNKATTDATFNVVGENNTTISWEGKDLPSSGFVEGTTVGVLNVTATGTHDSLSVSGKDVTLQGATVVLPFVNSDAAEAPIYARIMDANVNGTKNSGLDGQPGWSVPYSISNNGVYSLEFKAVGTSVDNAVTAGTYSAQIYVQQWQN